MHITEIYLFNILITKWSQLTARLTIADFEKANEHHDDRSNDLHKLKR